LLKNLKNINWQEIDAIAVSADSGIYTCILTGVSIAKTLANCYKKPLIEIDHLLAHIYSTWLERNPNDFKFPILVFSASGSHSDFVLLNNKNECRVIYGAVPQKAKGEINVFIGIGKIFYQMGKDLGVITSADAGVSKLMEVAKKGDVRKFDFVKYYQRPVLDLNFSGFMDSINRFIKKKKQLSPKLINDIAASFQESITKILTDKIIKLAENKKVKEIHIAGGISENKYLENKLKQRIEKEKLPFVLRYPAKKQYRLDNAAMIGCLAHYQKKYKIKFKNFKPNITK
jgi:N6-L-threonylcarbamoyladenine synthase